MPKMICLANSRKDHERCVAGIDPTTGKLIRPVSRTKTQAIPEDWTLFDGSPLKPLDVIDVPFESGDTSVPFQAENPP